MKVDRCPVPRLYSQVEFTTIKRSIPVEEWEKEVYQVDKKYEIKFFFKCPFCGEEFEMNKYYSSRKSTESRMRANIKNHCDMEWFVRVAKRAKLKMPTIDLDSDEISDGSVTLSSEDEFSWIQEAIETYRATEVLTCESAEIFDRGLYADSNNTTCRIIWEGPGEYEIRVDADPAGCDSYCLYNSVRYTFWKVSDDT